MMATVHIATIAIVRERFLECAVAWHLTISFNKFTKLIKKKILPVMDSRTCSQLPDFRNYQRNREPSAKVFDFWSIQSGSAHYPKQQSVCHGTYGSPPEFSGTYSMEQDYGIWGISHVPVSGKDSGHFLFWPQMTSYTPKTYKIDLMKVRANMCSDKSHRWKSEMRCET